jgi:hypothetical protein
MVNATKSVIRNGRSLFRAMGERGIEKNFAQLDQFRIKANDRLSDHLLVQGYMYLISELENEADTDVKKKLMDEIVMFEAELIKRDLLESAHSA